ncbi:hypothetical protein ACIG0C_28570 [Kitasatospora aureofaciens]|uniref:DUF4352 domain-containing protein n=1 Tax=Kitasatospora aureofaciens TaxID=1894 RepID=A0A1E7NA67_KITAU|nr:hypothetical protein [Kitasatospora aureofaciens]ARF79027.1 hypothetical protein B6264_08935 [Kitasatospora aureofaciens]OEV37544.1 hypothetical protein HS99_0026420 [Kitasatospora aureofaciens]GGU83404.1 hypothetical protein GCM10010502_39370 [Kitasatospora aureofaciens]
MKTIRNSRTMALAGLAVVGALTMTACNDDAASSDSASTPPATRAPAAPTGAPTTAAASGSAAAPGGDATGAVPGGSTAGSTGGAPAQAGPTAAPGTTLKIGDAATVPFSSGSTKGTVSLAVTSIDKGDPADLAPLKLGDKVTGMVPYYVRFKVTNTGSTDLSFASLTQVKGTLPDGSEASEVMLIGTFDKCPHPSFPKGFTNGQSITSCVLALAPTATKVAGAEYWGEPYTLGKGVNWK